MTIVKKKEATSEVSVEQRLVNLFELQSTLSKIDEIKTLRGELPLEVQDLEDEIEGLSLRIRKYQDEISDLNASVAKKKHEIERAEVSIIRYKEQLDNVRNNREYDMLSKEIEYQTLEIELLQKKIGEDERNVSYKESEITNISDVLKERRADLEVKKTELDEIVSETHADEEVLREKSKELELRIEPRLLTAFKRIRKSSRNGLGIVPVLRGACGGCFNKIPPQRQLDIRMRKKVIVCEYCGRVLIDPELAGYETAKPADEEKPKRRRKAASAKE